jgi:plastocyanin
VPNTVGPLVGPLLIDPDAAYTVSIAGLRPGVYRDDCTPHLALGMRGTMTIVK